MTVNLPSELHSPSELQWRGLVQDSTGGPHQPPPVLSEALTFYVGFDPTAASLHVGHLLPLLTARRLQQAGHRPIALVGGATGLIGDPRLTGERPLLDPAQVAEWVPRIRAQVEPFLHFDGAAAARMVNNREWVADEVIAFFSSVGKHFGLGAMLDRSSVRARLPQLAGIQHPSPEEQEGRAAAGAGMSFTEFAYPLFQANDFRELYLRYGVTLQFGGSDQWTNLLAGVNLIRRAEKGTAHAFTTPLVTKADGTKFGKSERGAVWLDPTMTSPFAFLQFWLNTEDAKMAEYLRYFSFRPAEEIQHLLQRSAERPAAREAQHALAEELTVLVHGADEYRRAQAATVALFGRGDLRAVDEATLGAAMTEVPHATISGTMPSVVDLLVATGLSSSRSDAMRTVASGGAYVNKTKVTDPAAVPAVEDLLHGRFLVVHRGKRSPALVEVMRDTSVVVTSRRGQRSTPPRPARMPESSTHATVSNRSPTS